MNMGECICTFQAHIRASSCQTPADHISVIPAVGHCSVTAENLCQPAKLLAQLLALQPSAPAVKCVHNAGTSQSIILEDMDTEAAELLLQYIYGCLRPQLSLTAAVALFRASDKYAMSSLHQQCTRLLKSLITFDNLLDLAELAQLHHSIDLLQVSVVLRLSTPFCALYV